MRGANLFAPRASSEALLMALVLGLFGVGLAALHSAVGGGRAV